MTKNKGNQAKMDLDSILVKYRLFFCAIGRLKNRRKLERTEQPILKCMK